MIIIKKLRSLFYLFLISPIFILAIPVVVILRLIRPWFLIRWHELRSNRIGHFAKDIELYCCLRDAGINIPSQRYIDFFYLDKAHVCNRQLEKMWRRTLILLPRWLLFPLFIVNRFIGRFVSGGNYHEIGKNANTNRDIYNLMNQSEPHINFTYDEEAEGKRLLTEFGIPEDTKLVCLLVRDSGYSNRYNNYETDERWSYHNYRNGDIDRYVLAAEELTRRGYYVFRMGANVLKPIKSSNPKIIDYANAGMRSEFMDVYLGAKCCFCISTSAGFDAIPEIFRKPIAYSGHVPIADLVTSNKENLILIKHHINKRNQQKLTVSEIFSSNIARSYRTDEFKKNEIELEENSPEEIKDLVIEMDERLNERWEDTKEDLLLQKRFWSIFEKHIIKLNLKLDIDTPVPAVPRLPYHGKIKARFGAKFLRDNQNWIR